MLALTGFHSLKERCVRLLHRPKVNGHVCSDYHNTAVVWRLEKSMLGHLGNRNVGKVRGGEVLGHLRSLISDCLGILNATPALTQHDYTNTFKLSVLSLGAGDVVA